MVLYDIKLNLIGVTNPVVWRRVRVDSEMTFGDFSEVVISVFGFEDYHLHAVWVNQDQPDCYEIGDPQTYDPDFAIVEKFVDERTIKLKDLLPEHPKDLIFNYDFGDNWEIGISLRGKKKERLPGGNHWELTDAYGAGPVEDCGGRHAFMRYRDLAVKGRKADTSDEEWEIAMSIFGPNFDPKDPTVKYQ